MACKCDKCSTKFNVGYSDSKHGYVCVQCLYDRINLNEAQQEFADGFFKEHSQYVPITESADKLRRRLLLHYKRYTIFIILVISWIVYFLLYSSLIASNLKVALILGGCVILIFLLVYYFKWLSSLNESLVANNTNGITSKLVLSALILFYGFYLTKKESEKLLVQENKAIHYGRYILI
jgi:hypothetical protein